MQAATQKFYHTLLEQLRGQGKDSLTLLVIGGPQPIMPGWHLVGKRQRESVAKRGKRRGGLRDKRAGGDSGRGGARGVYMHVCDQEICV